MPFIWNSNPNPPPANVAPEIASTEISYKVHVVANTVNAGGEVSYNTPNAGYDVIYELDSLNVRTMRVQSGIIGAANIGTAFINNATINQASINTANITHATINVGFFTGNATANFSMVSKQYVDNAIANISGGSGPDLTANIFQLKGDLLVGFAPNTAHRLGVGDDGEILSVRGSSNLKTRWISSSSTQSFSGLRIGTHFHPTLKHSQVLLNHVDGIVMNDGEYVTGWDGLVADITVSGAGGLDSNSAEAANTWYEVWAIRNSNSGAKSLLLHRTLNREINQEWVPTTFGGVGVTAVLRIGDAAGFSLPSQRYCTKVSQSFIPSSSNPIGMIQLASGTNVTPNGNLWISIQSDSSGNASGSSIATSESILVNGWVSGRLQLSFIFDTTVSLTPGGRYHIVMEGDWDYLLGLQSNAIIFWGNSAPISGGQQQWMANVGYNPGGNAAPYGFGDCRMYNVVTDRWSVSSNIGGPSDLWFKLYTNNNDTSLALPSGYNQRCLISYVNNNGSSNFKEYHQMGRTIYGGYDDDWRVHTLDSSTDFTLIASDVSSGVPPVPCAVQFLGRQFLSSVAGINLGLRNMYGLTVSSVNDTSHGPLGSYTFGGFTVHTVLSHTMPLDGIQVVNWNGAPPPGAGDTLYMANITF
jgi:hypothetical protein